MSTPDKFDPFRTTDISPFIEEVNKSAKTLAPTADFDSFSGPMKAQVDGFSVSVDIQEYIDEAVTKLHHAVRDRVESNLQSLLKEAFMMTIEPLRLQPVATEGLWRSFLQKLSQVAEVADDDIEARRG